ncbi:MAG TPA: type II secretion system protein [Candidatus Saccharimonadales bacterium]|nr:type II secretion system protein [Candidatus Saccharimonadales bacterium]
MISLKKRNQGFTIVELLIVIVVIGILALLVITTYSGIQAKARNSKRQTDVQSLQTQVEAYFSQNGFYPSYADLSDASWVSSNMKSLDVTAMIDPSSGSTTATLIYSNSAGGTTKKYEYYPTNSSGTTCEADDTTCAQYTMIAKYEGTVNGQSTYTKSNLD